MRPTTTVFLCDCGRGHATGCREVAADSVWPGCRAQDARLDGGRANSFGVSGLLQRRRGTGGLRWSGFRPAHGEVHLAETKWLWGDREGVCFRFNHNTHTGIHRRRIQIPPGLSRHDLSTFQGVFSLSITSRSKTHSNASIPSATITRACSLRHSRNIKRIVLAPPSLARAHSLTHSLCVCVGARTRRRGIDGNGAGHLHEVLSPN